MAAKALMPARSNSLFFAPVVNLAARCFSAWSTAYSIFGIVKLSRTSFGFFALSGALAISAAATFTGTSGVMILATATLLGLGLGLVAVFAAVVALSITALEGTAEGAIALGLGRTNSFLATGVGTPALTAGLRATTGFTATARTRGTAPDIKAVLAERVTVVFAGNAARLVIGVDIETFRCETVLASYFSIC